MVLKKKKMKLAPHFKPQVSPEKEPPPQSSLRYVAPTMGVGSPFIPFNKIRLNKEHEYIHQQGYKRRKLPDQPDYDKEDHFANLGLRSKMPSSPRRYSMVGPQHSFNQLFQISAKLRKECYRTIQPLPITSKAFLYNQYAFHKRVLDRESATSLVATREYDDLGTKFLWPTLQFKDETMKTTSAIPDSDAVFQSRDWIDKRPKAKELKKKAERKLLEEKAEAEAKRLKWIRDMKKYSRSELQQIIPQLRQDARVVLPIAESDRCEKCSRFNFIVDERVVQRCPCSLSLS